MKAKRANWFAARIVEAQVDRFSKGNTEANMEVGHDTRVWALPLGGEGISQALEEGVSISG